MNRYYEGSNPKLDKELRKLRRKRVVEDSFNNLLDSLSDYPAVGAWFRVELEREGYRLLSKAAPYDSLGVGVPPGFFELQRHTASVEEHVDDVSRGVYFGLFVVKSSLASRSRRGYSTENELRYYDSQGNKTRTSLLVGSLLVFNPRREHELIYYGEKATFMLFSVEKLKND